MAAILLLALVIQVSAAVLPRELASDPFTITMTSTDHRLPANFMMDEHARCHSFASGDKFSLVDGQLTRGNDPCYIMRETSALMCTSDEMSPESVEPVSFDISTDYRLTYNGTDKWLHCLDEDRHFRCFTDSKEDQGPNDCLRMVLEVGQTPGFKVQQRSVPPTSNRPAIVSSTSNDACPSGGVAPGEEFQFPHLIVPVNSAMPDQAYGTQYDATLNSTTSTLFNFDIPAWEPYPSSTCNLVFLFPFGDELSPYTPKYVFSGTEAEIESDGGINFALLDGVADGSTNYDNKPSVAVDYGLTQVVPGNEYTIATFPCEAGRFTYEASAIGELSLNYWQSSAPAPIGLYVVPCAN